MGIGMRELIIILLVVLVVFGALAGLIPAYHAAKIQPVEALRTD